MKKELIITGIRGVPASHGGFETFAENLAVYLVKKGWNVTVYCQESYEHFDATTVSEWEGVRRIHIPVKGYGAKATVAFDYLSVRNALKQPGLVLTLGYNTALFNLWFRLKGKKNLINMDGIEWKRDKWAWYERAWLYFNERMGCLIGNHLVADHPEIKNHLKARVSDEKITMVPYGARAVLTADEDWLAPYGIQPKQYALLIARPEPENSILEVVKAFSAKKRNHCLVVLGRYEISNAYHAEVLAAASDEVKFIGAVYEHSALDALRFFASLYIHGHTVGGTNPSLIEALGASQPVLAHDNQFNRWVAGEKAEYFNSVEECSAALDCLLNDGTKLSEMAEASQNRFNELFTWETVLKQYENLLVRYTEKEQ